LGNFDFYEKCYVAKYLKIYVIFRLFLPEEVINYFMVHLGGLFYDLFVGFMLFFESTKKIAFGLSFVFHGLNSQLFDIGIFLHYFYVH